MSGLISLVPSFGGKSCFVLCLLLFSVSDNFKIYGVVMSIRLDIGLDGRVCGRTTR